MRKNFLRNARISYVLCHRHSPFTFTFRNRGKITQTYLIHVLKYYNYFLSLSISDYELTGFEEDTGAENVKEHEREEQE